MGYVKSFRWLCSKIDSLMWLEQFVYFYVFWFFFCKPYTLFLCNVCPYEIVTIRNRCYGHVQSCTYRKCSRLKNLCRIRYLWCNFENFLPIVRASNSTDNFLPTWFHSIEIVWINWIKQCELEIYICDAETYLHNWTEKC